MNTNYIDDLRLESEALLLEMSVMYWRAHEYGEPVDFQSVLRGHERLYSPETIRMVKRNAVRCEDPSEKRAMEFLMSHLADLYMTRQTAPRRDRLQNAEMRARVRFDGRSILYRELPVVLANEPDPARRRKIHSLEMDVVRRFNPEYARLWRREHAIPKEIGSGSYMRLSEAARHVRLREVAVVAKRLLDITETVYSRLLDQQSRALLGFGADAMRRSDVLRLMKNVTVEHHFPAGKLLSTVRRTTRVLGFDLRRMNNLRIFAEERPNKAPRAVCCPMKVPYDVRLSVRPVGGVQDYETLLHEMGHGLHFASTRTDRFEFQHLGGNAVTETYAFLFQYLVENRHWLATHTRMSEHEIASFLRSRALAKLLATRRYAAKVLYEIHFHSGRKRPRDTYRRLLSRAYGFPFRQVDASVYLNDVDPTFYAADYLRAWLLEATLSNKLEGRFGLRWFERASAGKYLARLWASGSQMTADELLAELGARGLAVGAWLKRVKALLRL
jgi:hypothetical protein